MGVSGTYTALPAARLSEVLEILALKPSKKTRTFSGCIPRRSEVFYFVTESAWVVFVAGQGQEEVISNRVLERLSKKSNLYKSTIEEHVNYVDFEEWRDGKPIWSLRHDRNISIDHLEITDGTPRDVREIIDSLLQQLNSIENEDDKHDVLSDIPETVFRMLNIFELFDSGNSHCTAVSLTSTKYDGIEKSAPDLITSRQDERSELASPIADALRLALRELRKKDCELFSAPVSASEFAIAHRLAFYFELMLRKENVTLTSRLSETAFDDFYIDCHYQSLSDRGLDLLFNNDIRVAQSWLAMQIDRASKNISVLDDWQKYLLKFKHLRQFLIDKTLKWELDQANPVLTMPDISLHKRTVINYGEGSRQWVKRSGLNPRDNPLFVEISSGNSSEVDRLKHLIKFVMYASHCKREIPCFNSGLLLSFDDRGGLEPGKTWLISNFAPPMHFKINGFNDDGVVDLNLKSFVD